jgi:YVTN family beta-propeller protein
VTEQNLLYLAQQGNPEAIASLLNQALAKKNIAATTSLEGKSLQVTLTSDQLPPQDLCIYVISEGMRRLSIPSIQFIRVIGQQRYSKQSAWSQIIEQKSDFGIDATSPPTPLLQSEGSPTPVPPLPPREGGLGGIGLKQLKTKISLPWLILILSILAAALGATFAFQRPSPIAKKPTRVHSQLAIAAKKPKPKVIPKTTKKSPQVRTRPRATRMRLKATIAGNISPKSVVHSGQGLFFAQNMMYRHTITVYNRQHKLVKTIPDRVNLAKYGYGQFQGTFSGAPVEASFSHDGKYAWVSNYQMYGRGFNNPGSDRCSASQGSDRSFLYRINTKSFQIEKVIKVGAVPKYVATTPDHRLILVSNWCSWDLSVVDTQKNQEIERIKLGRYPRGIVVDSDAKNAYVAVMGSSNIARVNLQDYSVKWLRNIGRSPRHLNIDPSGKYLYASLNGEGRIAKIALPKGQVTDKVLTGNAPRSMVLSDDGQLLYVVNYNDNTVSKVRTSDMKVLQKVKVAANPIGITYDPQTRQIWVACYSGSIMVFQD